MKRISKTIKGCIVDNCDMKHYGNGYCSRHWQQIRLYGKILERSRNDPNKIVNCGDYFEIVIYNVNHKEVGRALVDIDDIDRVKKHRWCLNGKGYSITSVKGKTLLLHHLILPFKRGYNTDHQNRNRLDNRRDNLRYATYSENCQNTSLRNDNSSGHSGVNWYKERRKWVARLSINGRRIYLGMFKNKQQAIRTRNVAERKYYKEFSPNN